MSFTRDFTSGSPPIGSDSSGSGSTAQATSAGFNLSTGRLVAVRVKWEAANGTCTVADTAGNTYTAATKQRDATNELSTQWFYCLNTTFGNASNIWTATLPTGSLYRDIVAFIYTPGGIASFIGESGAAQVSADTHAVSAAITAGTLAVCGGSENVGQAATPDSGWTEQSDVAANASHSFDRIDAPGGTVTPGFTFATSTSWTIAGITFSDAGTGPVITGLSTGTPSPGDSLVITGTAFGASQGAGSVTIGGVTQTVTAWADTSITVTVVRGSNKFGAALNVVVTDNALAASAPFGLTALLPISGWSYVNLTTINKAASNRLTASPDLESTDQISWETVSAGVTVAADATFYAVNSVRSFQFEVWSSGGGWGLMATQEFSPPALFTFRRKNGGRTHTKLWRREGWINTRVSAAGWFNKDLILPAAASSLSASVAETLNAADTITASAVAAAVVAEIGSAADTISAIAGFNAVVTETGSVADTVSATADFNAVVTETLSGVDTVSALLTIVATVSEALSGADTVTASALFSAIVAETLAAVDTVTVSAVFSADISETLSAVDTTDASIAGAGGNTYNVSIDETLNAVDTIDASAVYSTSVAETLTAADTVDTLLTQLAAVIETLNAADTVMGATTATASISETLVAADTVSTLLIATASVNEILAALETVFTQTDFNAVVLELMNANDSISATGGVSPPSSGHAYYLLFKRRTRR